MSLNKDLILTLLNDYKQVLAVDEGYFKSFCPSGLI